MIKFDVFSRFHGALMFTAEIDCEDYDKKSVKLGLSVKWALRNKANLTGANLTGANLYDANLEGADLYGADLTCANLSWADLTCANLEEANLEGADLTCANLSWADLTCANLEEANLEGADLTCANLSGANGVNDFIKCIQIETYPITYTDEVMQIGCEQHKITEWREFDNRRIAEMDGKSALKFWAKYKDWIFQTIELCPSKSTKNL